MKFRQTIRSQIEFIQRNIRIRKRNKTVKEIYYKLYDNNLIYEKRNSFIEFQIEDNLRFLASQCSQTEKDRYRSIVKVQKAMLRKQLDMKDQQERKQAYRLQRHISMNSKVL